VFPSKTHIVSDRLARSFRLPPDVDFHTRRTLLVSATDPAYAPDFPSFGFSFHLIQLDLLSSLFASAEAARREDRKLDRILRKF
jgi:hypothetical protein